MLKSKSALQMFELFSVGKFKIIEVECAFGMKNVEYNLIMHGKNMFLPSIS